MSFLENWGGFIWEYNSFGDFLDIHSNISKKTKILIFKQQNYGYRKH